ncbi:MAG: carboxypeptidase regulatory-like domain-containing protein [Saprospiraceae bacterium]|nr:carboxypeptidase regulatory-like domain-containing protein [Saprospiraceae bacterium]
MKKPIHNVLIFFFLHFTYFSHSQVIIKGSVKSEENNNLAYATITLKTLQDSLVAYTVSDEAGRYLIKINTIGTYQLHASYVGHQPFVVPIYILQINQDTIEYDILLEPTTLETVEITAKRKAIVITNDSIIYNAASFTQLQDKSLTEVLARLPGVKMENGKIYVNNEQVDEVAHQRKKNK